MEKRKLKVLFVCLGNICRSPMAEGILRSKIGNRNIEIDSAGTSHFHIGEEPDHRAVHTLRKKKIDISNLRARRFDVEDFEAFDLIFAMDTQNREKILQLAQNEEHHKRVSLMLDLTFPGQDREVPDPYFGGGEGFEQVFHLLNDATQALIEKYDYGQ